VRRKLTRSAQAKSTVLGKKDDQAAWLPGPQGVIHQYGNLRPTAQLRFAHLKPRELNWKDSVSKEEEARSGIPGLKQPGRLVGRSAVNESRQGG